MRLGLFLDQSLLQKQILLLELVDYLVFDDGAFGDLTTILIHVYDRVKVLRWHY